MFRVGLKSTSFRLLAFAILIGVGFGTGILICSQHDSSIESRKQVWNSYTSTAANVHFQYPAGWTVMENITKGQALENPTGRDFLYTNLGVCPPPDKLLTTPKSQTSNCVSFFTSLSLIHSPIDFVDLGDFFSEFQEYIQDPRDGYDHFRILSYVSSGESNFDINLLGLYRNHAQFIGIHQSLCAQDENDACVIIFKHILDSVRFVN